jgi:hypothetical protein
MLCSGLQQFVHAPLHYVQEKLSTLESKETPEEDAGDREWDNIDVSKTANDGVIQKLMIQAKTTCQLVVYMFYLELL